MMVQKYVVPVGIIIWWLIIEYGVILIEECGTNEDPELIYWLSP